MNSREEALAMTPSVRHRWLTEKHEQVKQWFLPQSHWQLVFLSAFFSCITGLIAFVYSTAFENLLVLVWEIVPRQVVRPFLESRASLSLGWLYTVLVSTVFGMLVGLTQRVMGFPGDLPDIVKSVHDKGRVPIRQAPSMFLCSTFSICAGGSLGPEAPLLALCAASVSWVARKGFGYTGQKLRNCTLMGMTAGLAAFFGVALGGSIFALEVLHRNGLQFYEISTYAVATGALCLFVFRSLNGEHVGAIWSWPEGLVEVHSKHIIVGCLLGILTAAVAMLFMHLHKALKWITKAIGLDEHKTPVASGMMGGLLIGLIGAALPPTMFWGEFEIQSIATPLTAPLAHIWPKGGIWGIDPFDIASHGPWIYFLIAFAKLVTISLTVLSGFRGGFIFPLFMAGSAFGAGLARLSWIPLIGGLPPVMPAMCAAAGLNTAITRTPFATSLILTILSGHPQVAVPTLTAALTSLFLTLNHPFILAQRDRDDVSFIEPQFPSDDEEEGDQLYGDEFGDEEFCGHESVDDSAHGRSGALEALLGAKH